MKPAPRIAINCRNYGHWDIYADGVEGRAFRIRGTPGNWLAMDERKAPYPTTKFKEFPTCLAFILAEFMHEELTTDESSHGNNTPIKP